MSKVFCGFLVVFPSPLWCSTCLQLSLSLVMALSNPHPIFCDKYFFNDKLLASKVTSMVQQPINSYIVGFNNYVPSTFDVPMFKEHESIVVVIDNKKRKQAEYDAHYKF